MAKNVRKTGKRDELDAIINRGNNLANRLLAFPNIGNGGTNGRLRTNAAISYAIDGQVYTEASTEDEWDLSALTTLTGSQFQAVALYLDASGTASIGAGTVAASAALALAALPAFVPTKAIIGVYVANASTNFGNALAAQGTIYNGVPTGACDVNGNSLSPEVLTSVAP